MKSATQSIPEAQSELLAGLLENVSRSFYRSLRVLPKSVRPQIGLAYLLARTTDTVADTEIVPVEERLRALQTLRERIQGRASAPADFGELARHQGSPAERILLEKCEAAIKLLEAMADEDRRLIRAVLDVITSGQELDVTRFGHSSAERVVALRTDAELEDYTYRVAGCVGEFWTRICRAHVYPNAALDEAQLLKQSVQFGKGLQLVNVLRDLPADLRKGRCYLPEESLITVGLTPENLLHPESEPKLRGLYDSLLDRAETYLAAGWTYTNALPWRHPRIRLACAWPILIGVKTIERLRVAKILDGQQRIKISRKEVGSIIRRSVLFYPAPGLWRRLWKDAPKLGVAGQPGVRPG